MTLLRVLGFRRLSVLALGVGLGMLVAPMTGRQLRAKLKERLASSQPLALPAVAGKATW